MATATRQTGRRGLTNTTNANSDSGAPLSPSSTGSLSTPPRRYVLDVPTGRTNRKKTTQIVDEYVTGTNASTENFESLSRSNSREHYRESGGYTEDATIKQLLESNATYTNTAVEDEEVQSLTARATPDIKNYPINVDSNPELIVRPNTQRLTYTQDIAVRYLKPSTPPPPGPIIIREIRAPPPPPAPPIILRQRPPPPRTPSPVIIRERPPARPKSVPTTVIKKVIPPPAPPPRKLIIERLPQLPPKPRPVVIERWLPYHKQKRQVIHEKAKPAEAPSRIKNTIIEWRSPEVEVVKHVKKLGITEFDPQRYMTQHGDQLYTTDFVQRKLTELGLQEELVLMQEQQATAVREESALEQADEYNVRQILNSYNQNYRTNNSVSRIVQSSTQSGIIDEYGDQQQQILYERSPNNSRSYIFETHEGTTTSPRSVLTEEMLLQSHSTSGGKFPTHLLTKLGSQLYDIPSDQVDYATNGRRVTTTTTTRYYTANQGETGYELTGDETVPHLGEEKYVQIKASDLKNVLANYDVYTSSGEKLDGEQVNY